MSFILLGNDIFITFAKQFIVSHTYINKADRQGMRQITTQDSEQYNSIDNDLEISLFNRYIPIREPLSRIDRWILWICIDGDADIEVDFISQHVYKNEIRILFPNQIVSSVKQSEDFAIMYFAFSAKLLNDVLFQFPPKFIAYLKDDFPHLLTDQSVEKIRVGYFVLIKTKFEDKDNRCRREIVINLLRNFFLETYNKNLDAFSLNTHRRDRKTILFEMFSNMVIAHYHESREVAFYANKLYITPKYLSIVVKEFDGRTAKEWIDDYVIIEIKLLLRSTSLSIQEIAYEINFANQSFLCKYFKSHTGLSPMQYRLRGITQ